MHQIQFCHAAACLLVAFYNRRPQASGTVDKAKIWTVSGDSLGQRAAAAG
jgi:hypothetical protein